MAFVCNATWIAKEGEAETVRAALEQLSPATRTEPGNIYYQAYRSPDEPNVFRIFEVYTDAEAFAAHGSYPHFERWALGQAIPALDVRRRDLYETLDY